MCIYLTCDWTSRLQHIHVGKPSKQARCQVPAQLLGSRGSPSQRGSPQAAARHAWARGQPPRAPARHLSQGQTLQRKEKQLVIGFLLKICRLYIAFHSDSVKFTEMLGVSR